MSVQGVLHLVKSSEIDILVLKQKKFVLGIKRKKKITLFFKHIPVWTHLTQGP